jgi:hypothetical protein
MTATAGQRQDRGCGFEATTPAAGIKRLDRHFPQTPSRGAGTDDGTRTRDLLAGDEHAVRARSLRPLVFSVFAPSGSHTGRTRANAEVADADNPVEVERVVVGEIGNLVESHSHVLARSRPTAAERADSALLEIPGREPAPGKVDR